MVAPYVPTVKTSSEDDEWDNLPIVPDTFYEFKIMQDTTSMTARIFELTTPYNNPFQSNRPRWLFVCSAGLLRSPTGAAIATEMGMNSRSCGSSSYALVPLSVNLIMWAEKIFFVNSENYMDAKITFENTGYEEDIETKSVVLNIPDEYYAFDPILCNIFRNVLKDYK